MKPLVHRQTATRRASPVHLECKFHCSLALPATSLDQVHHVVIGRVVGVHIRDDVLTPDGKLDVLKIRPLARLGYHDYTSVKSLFTMPPVGPMRRCATPAWKGGRSAPARPADDPIDQILPIHFTSTLGNCDQLAAGNSPFLEQMDHMQPLASQYSQQRQHHESARRRR